MSIIFSGIHADAFAKIKKLQLDVRKKNLKFIEHASHESLYSTDQVIRAKRELDKATDDLEKAMRSVHEGRLPTEAISAAEYKREQKQLDFAERIQKQEVENLRVGMAHQFAALDEHMTSWHLEFFKSPLLSVNDLSVPAEKRREEVRNKRAQVKQFGVTMLEKISALEQKFNHPDLLRDAHLEAKTARDFLNELIEFFNEMLINQENEIEDAPEIRPVNRSIVSKVNQIKKTDPLKSYTSNRGYLMDL